MDELLRQSARLLRDTEKQVEASLAFLVVKIPLFHCQLDMGNFLYASLPYISTLWVALVLSHHHVGKTSSIVIWINPLMSLMMDQCAKLTSLGLTAAFIGEAQLNPLEKESN